MNRALKIFTLIMLCIISLTSFSKDDKNYVMEDLRILASEKNFEEFFLHALDIRPTERSDSWKEMVEQLGIEFMEHLNTKSKIKKSSYKIVYRLSNWPIFKKNEFFNKRRDTLFLREIKQCFLRSESPEKCYILSNQIFNDYEHDLIFSYELVSLLALHTQEQKNLWKFAKPLVKNKLSEFYCHKPLFKEIVLNQIYTELSKNKDLKQSVHIDCFKSLTSSLRQQLYSNNDHQRVGAFRALSTFKAISKEDSSIFFILQFLSKPSLENTEIDKALKVFHLMGQDYKLRSKILAKLTKLDPLPGEIFSRPLKKKILAKTRILQRHFPEYIDNYASTCLNYLNGHKEYPHGNPTPKCHNLFMINKNLKLLPASFTKRYNQATSFLNNSQL